MALNKIHIFPASGDRHYTSGKLVNSDRSVYTWSSTSYNSSTVWDFTSSSGGANLYFDATRFGFAVRCVQASATVFAFTKDTFVFFPASGNRGDGDGKLYNSGASGFGWSSASYTGDYASRLFLNSGSACMGSAYRTFGFAVRCVQASAAVFAFTENTFVFFPATGFRYVDAKLYNVNAEGHGWTSTPTGGNAWHYGGSAGNTALAVHSREFGFPVRCVQASAAVFVYARKDIEETFLFFPATGFRNYNSGSLGDSGKWGYCWTSTPLGGNAWYLDFYTGPARVSNGSRGYGFPVRCVQASAAVWAVLKKTIRQIRFRRESGKVRLCRRGQADSVTRLGRKFSASENCFVCVAPSYSFSLIKLPVFNGLYFYKHSSGYFLFFPAPGYRETGDGKLYNVGTRGDGWSSTPNGDRAVGILIVSGDVRMYDSHWRGSGFPVRCVQASATVWIYLKKNRKQIQYRRESGKEYLYRRGRADSVTRLGCKLSANENRFVYAAPSYSFSLIKLPVFNGLYFYKHSSGYFFFFPASGWRHYNDGMLYNSGVEGDGWTSASNGSSNAYFLCFYSGNAYMYNDSRTLGRSVRCVQASALVFAFIKDTFVFFAASGNRNYSDGKLGNSGISGYGWSSTPAGSNAWYLDVWSSNARVLDNVSCGFGFSVRCVQASATVWFFQKENRKQIRYRRESGKVRLCRRGQADSVTRLGCKLSANENHFVCAAPSYSISLIKLPVFIYLYFYKHASGYFLFFPASGYRSGSDGNLFNSGVSGYGWSSTPNGSSVWRLEAWSAIAHMDDYRRADGFSVRCVQASASVFVYARKGIEKTPVFFPAAGLRGSSAGKLVELGVSGYGWSSTGSDNGNAYSLIFYSRNACSFLYSRSSGYSVRCVQASAAVFAFTKDMFCFFPATGYREFSDGRYSFSGSWGLVWASTPSSGSAWSFTISSGRPYMNANNRGYGFSVRCVQASAAVFVFSNYLQDRRKAA